ncbi:response regulator transcription factor [Agriterribacter sp.]|uniref:response regulator transcription factor n=1 Tax=Agriterribacter sp. TaxID=2821509 RepID=UPI002C5C33F0|nr:response regulator transcription factor [Agriterribacter sp.]HRO44278.1 response regulator transcription factor [Agriterribacter sp.]HRQ18272.1 response regulator transcription factor [Agriterribacter sp.]
MINIYIIDDHPLVAGGIAMMLKDVAYVNITGTATTANEAATYLKDNKPEIILLDISLPDMDGLQLCDIIRKENKYSKIIGLTSANESSIITQLLHRGANGYLLKNMERKELLEAIDKVMDGKIFLSQAANEKVLEHFSSLSSALNEMPAITRREKEILLFLEDGLNGPQIAARLFISPYTVETHRKNLMQKLNASSTQQLLKTAKKLSMI